MSRSDGHDDLPYAVPRRSSPVKLSRRRSSSRFTREEILRAVHDWVDQHGEPPTTLDWDPARARRAGHGWRATRFEAGTWPSARIVGGVFGSFNAAVEAAGHAPRPAPVRVGANLTGSDSVLEAIREWVRRYGDLPAMADWDPARARRLKQDWRIARYHDGDWPSVRTVAFHFGSLSAAVAAAGLRPREPASQWDDRRQDRAANRRELARLAAAQRQPGLEDLASCLRRLASARKSSDPVASHAALIDLASAALAWAEAPAIE